MRKSSSHRFRCFAEGRGNQWSALCLDLDIAVDGASFEEVYRDLNKAVEMYLQRAAEFPEAERARMLRRKAPWHVRLPIMIRALRIGLTGGPRDDDRQSHGYTLPCPA